GLVAGRHLDRRTHVVGQAVRAHHGEHLSLAHLLHDLLRVTRGVDDDDLFVVTHDPGVVLDLVLDAVDVDDALGHHSLDTRSHGADPILSCRASVVSAGQPGGERTVG